MTRLQVQCQKNISGTVIIKVERTVLYKIYFISLEMEKEKVNFFTFTNENLYWCRAARNIPFKSWADCI